LLSLLIPKQLQAAVNNATTVLSPSNAVAIATALLVYLEE